MTDKENTYHCPDCDSDQVITEEHEQWELNTNKFYCHSLKRFDADSPASCLDCDWKGLFANLSCKSKPKKKKKLYRVEIVELFGDEVVETILRTSKRSAECIERGLSNNLDHERYYTRIQEEET